MRNREPVLRKLDSLESNTSKLTMALNQGNRELCYKMIEEFRSQIEQLKMYVESEPVSGNELNRI
jgi:hypothetical protein